MNKIVAGIVISLVYLKMIQVLKPFKDPQLNVIKETSLWQIFFVFQIALVITKDSEVDRNFITFCLMLAFFMNVVILVFQYVVQYFKGFWITEGAYDHKGKRTSEVELRDNPMSCAAKARNVTADGSVEGIITTSPSYGTEHRNGDGNNETEGQCDTSIISPFYSEQVL